ncbi:MAG: hypothetical protein LBB94_02320, partial [Clostridiales bacterium]|nr:hypothetical protein [Clostridiales bacterium]
NCDHQTKVAAANGFKLTNELQTICGATIYPVDVFSPIHFAPVAFTSNTLSVHHFNGSWADDDTRNTFRLRREKCARFHNKFFLN